MALSLALACVAPAAHAEQVPVPDLSARVTDLTHTLSPETVKNLTSTLSSLEKAKGAQIAVLMVPTTGSDTIEQYARRVFDQWKLGRKNVDDGILFVIAKNDRRMRIEVGYGLGGAVPDILAGRIIREQVAPRFRQGDFDQGVVAGVDSLAKLVKGEDLPAPAARPDRGGHAKDQAPVHMLLPLVFMSLVTPAVFSVAAAAVFVYLMFHSLGLALLGAAVAFFLSRVGRAARAGRGARTLRASRNGIVFGGIAGGLGSGVGRGGFGGGGFGGGMGGGFGGGGGGSGGGGASGGW